MFELFNSSVCTILSCVFAQIQFSVSALFSPVCLHYSVLCVFTIQSVCLHYSVCPHYSVYVFALLSLCLRYTVLCICTIKSLCFWTIHSGVFAQCSMENVLLIGNITGKLFTCRVSVHLPPEKRKDNKKKIMKCAILPDTSRPRLPFITEEQLCPLTRRVMCIQK